MRWRQKKSGPMRRRSLWTIVAILTISFALLQLKIHDGDKRRNTQQSDSSSAPKFVPYHGPLHLNTTTSRFSDKQATANAALVQEKRVVYERKMCKAKDEDEVDWFLPPEETSKSSHRVNKPCLYALLDLGANVGDSLGKFIDAGISSECTGRYSLSEGRIRASTEPPNMLTNWTRTMMEQFAVTHAPSRKGEPTAKGMAYPENYCYVGVEGNPAFTNRLKILQDRILSTSPRPLRHVHFFTETVATGEGDGPTRLYLDTVNGKNNFFGSSLLSEHTDVRRSAVQGKPVAAAVHGVTLSTMLKQTVKRQAGAHVIIKIDIEGAEYALLNEAFNSGVLCDFVASGVRVDVRVEIHPKVRRPSLQPD